MTKEQVEQDIKQLTESLRVAKEQADNWNTRVNKTAGAIEYAQIQLQRFDVPAGETQPSAAQEQG